MTTSTMLETGGPAIIEQGKMYKCGDLVVLCVSSETNTSYFEGVVIHPGSRAECYIGKYLAWLDKNSFTIFKGEEVLKS